MAVAVGLTGVDPLADVVVNVPGVIAIPVAPVTAQINALLEPDVMLAGFAEKVVITGKVAAFTVTVVVAVTDPAALVAVRT